MRERRVKFGNFLFPDCRDPARDGAVIDETLAEARLADELGIDVIWLAEHHFDGISVYADPIALAGALAGSLRHAAIGFAVLQTALHHPIRLAEQMALLDNLMKGRLIVGLGRGSSYNIYDYQGFGIDHHEAQARLDEAEAIMLQGVDRRRIRASRPVLAAQGPDAAAAALHKAASLRDPRVLGRCVARRAGAAGPALHDERAVARNNAAPDRPLSRGDARGRARRGDGRREPQSQLGVAQCLCRGERRRSRAHRDCGLRDDDPRSCRNARPDLCSTPDCASRCRTAICRGREPRAATG